MKQIYNNAKVFLTVLTVFIMVMMLNCGIANAEAGNTAASAEQAMVKSVTISDGPLGNVEVTLSYQKPKTESEIELGFYWGDEYGGSRISTMISKEAIENGVYSKKLVIDPGNVYYCTPIILDNGEEIYRGEKQSFTPKGSWNDAADLPLDETITLSPEYERTIFKYENRNPGFLTAEESSYAAICIYNADGRIYEVSRREDYTFAMPKTGLYYICVDNDYLKSVNVTFTTSRKGKFQEIGEAEEGIIIDNSYQLRQHRFVFTSGTDGLKVVKLDTSKIPEYSGVDCNVYDSKGNELLWLSKQQGIENEMAGVFRTEVGQNYYLIFRSSGSSMSLTLEEYEPTTGIDIVSGDANRFDLGCETLKGNCSYPYSEHLVKIGFIYGPKPIDEKGSSKSPVHWKWTTWGNLHEVYDVIGQNYECDIYVVPGIKYYYRACLYNTAEDKYYFGEEKSFVAPESSEDIGTLEEKLIVPRSEARRISVDGEGTLRLKVEGGEDGVIVEIFSEDGSLVGNAEIGTLKEYYESDTYTASLSKSGTYYIFFKPQDDGVYTILSEYKKKAPVISGGGGGGFIPPAQPEKPTISTGEGYTVTLASDGKTATIAVKDGYELVGVTVNGASKGIATSLSDLKTGDKVEVKVTKKVEITEADKIKAELKKVDADNFKARSKQVKLKNGKKAIKITLTNTSGVKFDGIEIFRSTKRNTGYGKKAIFTTKTGKYYNTSIKKGTKYYYRARGYVEIDGVKYYSDWSKKAWRTVK